MDDKTIHTVHGAYVVLIPVCLTCGNIESFTSTVSLVKKNTNCRCSVDDINKHSPATQAVNALCSEISYLANVFVL